MNDGVCPLLFTLFISTPCSTKYFIMAPFLAAENNGVSPSLLALFISTPCSTKYFTMISLSLSHAINSGVSPDICVHFLY